MSDAKPVTAADVYDIVALVLEVLESHRRPGGSLTTAIAETADEYRQRAKMFRAEAAELAKPPEPELEPDPEPPEAPLGVEDVITLDDNPKRLTVLAVVGGYVVVTYGGYPPYVYAAHHWKCVKLAEIKVGDVVRDVEYGLCRIVRIDRAGYKLATTLTGVRKDGLRQRHHFALVARGAPEDASDAKP